MKRDKLSLRDGSASGSASHLPAREGYFTADQLLQKGSYLPHFTVSADGGGTFGFGVAAYTLGGCRLTLSGHDGDGGQQIDDGPALYKEIIADEGRVIDRVALGRMEGLVDNPPCAVLGGGGPAEI
jgi:hypothetical protein